MRSRVRRQTTREALNVAINSSNSNSALAGMGGIAWWTDLGRSLVYVGGGVGYAYRNRRNRIA